MINVDSPDNSPDRAGPSRNTRALRASSSRAKSVPKPRPRAKRAVVLPPGDVIELTDSEGEENNNNSNARAGSSQQNQNQHQNQNRAGPSQAKRVLLLPPVPKRARERERERAAVAVGRPPAALHERLPLFLPEDSEDPGLEWFYPLAVPPPVMEAVRAPVPVAAQAPTAAPVATAAVVQEAPPGVLAPPELLRDEPPEEVAGAVHAVQENEVPFDVYVAQVLEIIPDVLPAHVFSLIEHHYPNYKDKVVEPVLHSLFENPDYPKAEAKGKGKRKRDADADDDEEQSQSQRAVKMKIDYGDKNRVRAGDPEYVHLALVSSITCFLPRGLAPPSDLAP